MSGFDPARIDTLCGYCQLADAGCPAFPLQTRSCVEFRPYVDSAHDAAVLIAGGLREARDTVESQRRFKLLCDVITGAR
jgi:hypothetical protein